MAAVQQPEWILSLPRASALTFGAGPARRHPDFVRDGPIAPPQ